MKVHADIGNRHHVASPLSAWLLMALVGPASEGPDRSTIAEAVGMEFGAARRAAVTLLEHPLPDLHLRLAAWNAPGASFGPLASPALVDHGEIPSPARLNAWASRGTAGLITNFTVDREAAIVLASALGVRLEWREPFNTTSSAALGPGSAWRSDVKRVLSSEGRVWHEAYVIDGGPAGDVGVHVAFAKGALSAVSVIGHPNLPVADVMKLAHAVAAGDRSLPRRSLFDLPLGEGPLCTVTERAVLTAVPDGKEESSSAVLPAWQAQSQHELLAVHLPALSDAPFTLAQTALARYYRKGFEGAAVSSLVAMGITPRRRPGLRRTAVIRFAHPYAVVTVGSPDQARFSDRMAAGHFDIWQGVPVLSAWVTEAAEPD